MGLAADLPVQRGALGVIFGGPSPRHDLSIVTGLQVARALAAPAGAGGGGASGGGASGGSASAGGGSGDGPGASAQDVQALYWAKNGHFFAVSFALEPSAFLEGTPAEASELHFMAEPGGGFFLSKAGLLGTHQQRLGLDVLVNCCHGGPGQDGALQAALDLAAMAYTGPSAASASLCADRLALSALLGRAGVPCVRRELVAEGPGPPAGAGLSTGETWPGPYLVRPRFAGSPMPAEEAEQWPDVARFLELGGPLVAEGLVVEPHLPGALRASVAARSAPALSLSHFFWGPREDGAAGARPHGPPGPGTASDGRRPPGLGVDLEVEMADATASIADLVGLRGVAVVDFLVEPGGQQWWVEQVDTIPFSFAGELWAASEVELAVLVSAMVEEARERPGAQWGAAGSDSEVLRFGLPGPGSPAWPRGQR